MGGGGDGGASERAAQTEAQKEQARAALNYVFGEGSGNAASSLDRNNFYKQRQIGTVKDDNGWNGFEPVYETYFDEPAYEAALKADADAAGANANKAAREKLYSTVRDNAFNAGKTNLDEKYDTAKRNNSFALFAQGLNGGSEDIDQNALLKRTYDQGLLDLGAQADSAKADLRSKDETSRLNLLNAINAGTDQASALSSAAQQLANNYDSAAATAAGTTLGNLFDTSGALYTKSNAAAGKQAATTDWWNTYNPVTGSSKKSSTGTITGA